MSSWISYRYDVKPFPDEDGILEWFVVDINNGYAPVKGPFVDRMAAVRDARSR